MRLQSVILALLVISSSVLAQTETVWRKIDQLPAQAQARRRIQPQVFQAFQMDREALQRDLAKIPKEKAAFNFADGSEVSLPMPDGTLARFKVVESPIMEPELAAKFPEIKTYLGQGIDDPAATVRFDSTPAGFHAQILSPKGAVYIDPAAPGDATSHIAFFKRDYRRAADGFKCLVGDQAQAQGIAAKEVTSDLVRSGSSLRTYRLACAATGEYTAFHGGTISAGMSAIVTAVNRVVGVYEKELTVRLVLVANNNLIVYTNSSADPYSNTNGSTMLGQNQSNLDTVIGVGNYDIGHVFSTGGGGIAGLGVVCINGSKARGVTGLTSPTGDAFYIDYVAHEIGHQFGANHTFNSANNSTNSSCGGGNRNALTAYEPGSGSTIMAYAGICGSDDFQQHSDPYFNHASFDEILAYTTTSSGNSCAVVTSTGNTAPTLSAGSNFTIPQSTPFILTATGSDPDGDPLTYCWEERDLGAAQAITDPDNGSSPIFRSFNPTTSPSRTFPQLSDILNNTTSLGEKLPTISRTLNFRVTARDNRAGGGGVSTADMQVTVNSSSGPFRVTSPGAANTWSGSRTVLWNVANTTASPVSAATVNILLSTNDGQSFSIVLATNTPNDGAETIVLPNVVSSGARIKVEAVSNIFFAVSDSFSLTTFEPSPVIVLESAALVAENCPPGNGIIDPGETVTVSFGLKNIGSVNASNVTATLQASGGVNAPTTPQNFGLIPAGGSVTRTFTFLASGVCGGSLVATLQLDNGGSSIGTVSRTFYFGGTNGSSVVSFTNSNSIHLPEFGNSGGASPYPSIILVSNLPTGITKLTVTLNKLTHTFPDDLDFLIVGPKGQHVCLMADAGGSAAITNIVLTFDDTAVSAPPNSSPLISGTYLPSFYETPNQFSPPAPPAPHGTNLSVFNGLDPNGNWALYIWDDRSPNHGSLAGWSISFSTSTPACCTGATPFPPTLSSSVDFNAGTVTLAWNSVIGQNYEVQFKNNLNDPDWTTLTTLTASDTTTSVVDGLGGNEKYYRVVVGP